MSFEELNRIDREWGKERERYMVAAKFGRRYVPSTGAAVVVGLISVSMGLVGIMLAFANARNLGGAAGLVPLLGMVFVVGGFAISFYHFQKAKRYQTAYRAYQHRRSKAQDQLGEERATTPPAYNELD